ncbi:MAG: putative DNA binding domain-containing protein [Deltaproteobacteria bacterium]|nr:putative DNA binding domain-containing protein [Deltaproteobacteria bacterium]MCK4269825.1 putative DNA binding domain-containing protein [Methanogenium sp.]
MRTTTEIAKLLSQLDSVKADDLEDQDLDFKEWNVRSLQAAIAHVIEMAICMANGGGGTVVFGVRDKIIGRANAIPGVPPEIDQNILMKRVYDATDPKITPIFEELRVPEGTGRLLIMQIYSGMRPYTDTSGQAKIRVGKDCQPLTGTMRRSIMVETGEGDTTADIIQGNADQHVSLGAVEVLKKIAAKEQAPEDLLSLQDHDFLTSLGLIINGQLSKAGLLLIGKEASIREYIPHYYWIHLRLRNDTEYSDRAEGRDPLIIALSKITDRIMAENPVTTINYGMFHFEYRMYPEIVLREALMNALSHADYRINSPIMVKQYPGRLEISNPGGFIGGITPQNILHHPPVARNPRLIEALTKLRLVNRSNLGISRMYKYMLIEGKEPPIIAQPGNSVKVILKGGELSAPFRAFVEREAQSGRGFEVDHLLILDYLLSHREIDIQDTAVLIQRTDTEARDILHTMEHERGYLEHGGSGRSLYWALHPAIYRELELDGHPYKDRRTEWEAAKMHVLSMLRQQKDSPDKYLTNTDIRKITRLNRDQVKRLMRELREQHPQITYTGNRRSAKYYYRNN